MILASKLKNSVTAIESLKQSKYFYNQDLVDLTFKKLPVSMMGNYSRYAAFEDHDKPDIIKIANFLNVEAEMVIAAGIALPTLNAVTNTETTKAPEKAPHKTRYNSKQI